MHVKIIFNIYFYVKQIGSFFMINLCLVVIATQFSETKKRETERMIAERRRFSRSTSTLLSDSANEPGSCWEELLKYIGHLIRKSKRRIVKKYNQYRTNKVFSFLIILSVFISLLLIVVFVLNRRHFMFFSYSCC